MTVNHDDLWAFEGKSVPIHWHNDLEISLPREGEAIYQVYQKSYTVRPGDVLLLNRNVPHSCHSSNNSHARYSTFLARPDFIYGEYGSDVERRCFRPFLQNSSVPCILLASGNSCTRTVIQKLNEKMCIRDSLGSGLDYVWGISACVGDGIVDSGFVYHVFTHVVYAYVH